HAAALLASFVARQLVHQLAHFPHLPVDVLAEAGQIIAGTARAVLPFTRLAAGAGCLRGRGTLRALAGLAAARRAVPPRALLIELLELAAQLVEAIPQVAGMRQLARQLARLLVTGLAGGRQAIGETVERARDLLLCVGAILRGAARPQPLGRLLH